MRGPVRLSEAQTAIWAYVFQCLGAKDVLSSRFPTIWASGRSELAFSNVSGPRALFAYVLQCFGASDAPSLRFQLFRCLGRSEFTFSNISVPRAL